MDSNFVDLGLKSIPVIDIFLTNDINDLKNSNLKEKNFEKLIITFNEYLFIIEKNIDKYINFESYKNDLENKLSVNKELVSIENFENVENKIIESYDKMLAFFEEDNINDFHILTNEYFLRKIFDNIFYILNRDQNKISSN